MVSPTISQVCKAALAIGACIASCPDAMAQDVRAPIELQGPNCSLTVPPNPAAKGDLPGTGLAVYPPAVAKTYSGCRITWWSVGDQVLWRSIVLFDGGRPKAYALIKPEPGGARETRCQYDGEVIVARFDIGGGAESNCPPANTLELSD